MKNLLILFLLLPIISFAQTPDTTYTVKWTVVDVIPAPCPDANKENEYGLGHYLMSTCDVLYLRTERTEKQKEFNTEKDADEFIKNMPLENKSGVAIGSHCENPIKIKNVHER